MKFKAFRWVCEKCGYENRDMFLGLEFDKTHFSCPQCEYATYNKYAYYFYRISRAFFCSLSISVFLIVIWTILMNLYLIPSISLANLLGAIATIDLLIFGGLIYKKRLTIALTRIVSIVIMEIISFSRGLVMAGFLCWILFITLCALGITVFDVWLLAGLSLAISVRYTILASHFFVSSILNKIHIRIAAIILIFLMIVGLSFAIVFLVVTALSELNLYKANSLLDIAVSLLIPAIISTIFVSSRKDKNPPTKSVL